MIEVSVDGVLIDNNSNLPVVLLRERDGDRVLPIYIGPFEASAIAFSLRQTEFPRPMTLDMMRLIIEGLGGRVSRVNVTRIEGDTYFAELILETGGRVVTIDARPSDSVGLALRAGCPIFVADEVMARAGQVVSEENEERLRQLRARLREIRPEDLGDYRM